MYNKLYIIIDFITEWTLLHGIKTACTVCRILSDCSYPKVIMMKVLVMINTKKSGKMDILQALSPIHQLIDHCCLCLKRKLSTDKKKKKLNFKNIKNL